MNELTEWLHWKWLLPETWQSFEWVHPIFLYVLPLAPLVVLVRWILANRLSQKLDFSMPETRSRKSWSAWLRFFPEILIMLSIAFILVALARPQKTSEQVERSSEGIDIMLVLDISESMQIEDFTPNRLEAAKKVARDFVLGRYQDRIGIVIFSGEAISYAPLTTDYELLTSLIDEIEFNMIQKGGTAIGLAIGVGINRMKDSATKSKVMILLSDGENTAGSINPITSANLANEMGIKIYTIAVGKEGRVPYGTDILGQRRYIENSLDESTLREIASIGQGEFFRATNNDALGSIFDRIDTYEKWRSRKHAIKIPATSISPTSFLQSSALY